MPNWQLVPLSVLVLFVCLFYAYTATYLAPYPGFDLADWVVESFEQCEASVAWCDANQNTLQIDDQLLVIGDLTYAEYTRGWNRVPFDGYNTGDLVPITFRRDGEQRTVDWQMLGPTDASRFRRLSRSLLICVPFWLAGTAILLFLRPCDSRWRVMISFNYITAVWLAAGIYAPLRVAYAPLVERILAWLGASVCLHLHLIVPSPLFRRHQRYILVPLYVIAIALASLEIPHALPETAFYLGLLLVFLGSMGVLIFRLLAKSSTSDRLAARLMLTGIGLALEPGVVLWVIPALLNASLPTGLALTVVTFAIPLLPSFYVYAIYKRRLGALEFRANRLLSGYSFFLLYATAFVAIFVCGSQLLHLSDDSMVFGLVVATLFSVAATSLYTRFRRLVDRLAYGTEHSPNDIVRVFASRISTALSLETLSHLVADEIAPSLLIHQSALLLLSDGDTNLVYVRGVEPNEVPRTPQQIQRLLIGAGQYRPTRVEEKDEFDWVRLVIPLSLRRITVGVWLLGRRDPDDYYPQSDIALLTTLASQVAVAVENSLLYARAQEEIVERKRAEEVLRQYTEQLRILAARLAEVEEAERRRIAGELHDQVGQILAVLGISLNTLRSHLTQEPEEVQSCLDDALGLVKQMTGRIRDVMADLRPPELDDYGLLSALHRYGEQFAVRTSIAVAMEGDEPNPRLPQHVENALFHIVQEALTNVAKHAQAKRATVSVETEDETVRLTVTDDGIGFNPAELAEFDARPHWGLLTMAERAESVGGHCRVESFPGKSTQVIVEVKR